MENFFEKKEDSTENPFIKGVAQKVEVEPKKHSPKRLNIIDMEVLNGNANSSEIDFLETKMNNLYQLINQHPQTLDPITLEKMKIEWEDLRLKLYKIRQSGQKSQAKSQNNIFEKFGALGEKLSKIMVFTKFYSPKIKEILGTFSEINKEVEELVKKSTPLGEENLKYGLLVNKICQASKLNCKITNEIK